MQQRVENTYSFNLTAVDLTNVTLRSVILDLLSGMYIEAIVSKYKLDMSLVTHALRYTGHFKPSSRRYIFEDCNPAGLLINRADLLGTGAKPFSWHAASYWLSKEVKTADEMELA